jgi:hypothetical protein
MATCWLLIIMMFSDAHYDDVYEYFLRYQKLVLGIKDNLIVVPRWLQHLGKVRATKQKTPLEPSDKEETVPIRRIIKWVLGFLP